MGTLNLIFRIPSKVVTKNGKRWVVCDECGTPQFRLAPVATINGMEWECRNAECKHKMIISV